MNTARREKLFQSELNIPVRGISMTPYFSPGDRIIVRWNKYHRPELGDILYFKQGDEWIFHRVVSLQFGQVVTKGDRSLNLDVPTIGLLKGVVIGKRKGHKVVRWGLGGQLFKRLLVYCSLMRLHSRKRFIRGLGLLGLWLFSGEIGGAGSISRNSARNPITNP